MIRWHHPTRSVPLNTERKFGGVRHVGADIIRPVVSPTGKQRRRIAPTMQYRTFASKIRQYHVETWYIGNIVTSPDQYGSAQNLPRWRADDIRYVIE